MRDRLETPSNRNHQPTTMMETILVLILLFFRYAYAAPQDQHNHYAKRQQDSPSTSTSSTPTSTPTSIPTTAQSPPHSLPTSVQTRIPIPPSLPPGGGVQTAIPQHPNSNPDKGPIIGFSIGIVVLALLFVGTGWMLFRRYKQRRQQQATSQNVVRLEPTNHSASSITKRSFDDTQSAASHK